MNKDKAPLNRTELPILNSKKIRNIVRNIFCGSVLAASMFNSGCSPTEGVSESHRQELAETQVVLNARFDNVNDASEQASQNSSVESASNTEDFQDYQAKISNIADDETVNVRPTPGTSVAALFVLPKGYEVTVIDKHGEAVDGYHWLKVKLSNGKTGWIAETFLVETD